MIKLSELVPLNLASEKEKFFASNFQYNPQFIYQTPIKKKDLLYYGKPKLWYLFLAKRILKKYLRENKTIEREEKKFLSQAEIEDLIKKRLSFYQLQNEYNIIFSNNFISRISVNNTKKIIKICLPIAIREEEIERILSHEIDTHIVRQLNYEQQSWFKQKRRYDFKPYLRTEEGLAAINELIASEHSLAYKSAINYLALNLALKKDFVTTFNFLYKIWQDPERVWGWTLKKKRGISDTSQKGAFTKDVVYFEGLIETLKYLKKNNNDPSEIYCGKISSKDINKAKKIGLSEKRIMPKIFSDNPALYKSKLSTIIQHNLF